MTEAYVIEANVSGDGLWISIAYEKEQQKPLNFLLKITSYACICVCVCRHMYMYVVRTVARACQCAKLHETSIY